MKRLYVDSLTSVGLVKDSDDPESRVLFYKSRPKQTSMAEITARTERALAKADRYIEQKRKREERKKMSTTPHTDSIDLQKSREAARARGEDVPDTPQEVVTKRLDAWARRRHIAPRQGPYGDLQKTRPELKAEWWKTAEGRTVRDWLRTNPSSIEKSGEIAKALETLDG